MPSFLFQNYVEGSNGTFWIGSILLWVTVAFSVWFSSLAPDAVGTKVKGLILTWARWLRIFPTGYMEIQYSHCRNAGLTGTAGHVNDWVTIQPHSGKSKAQDLLSFLHLDRTCHLKWELVTQPPCVSVSSSGEWR